MLHPDSTRVQLCKRPLRLPGVRPYLGGLYVTFASPYNTKILFIPARVVRRAGIFI